ncbi:von Willebrand factor A domain-containing protein 7-like [Alosa pseudoharengus]|uniref:von Willebrand factor A domain-containing protein 7-like n=1 Tax=Alosa pseudoharengus TaxID=34774 RepID=UPI003F8C18BA
MVLKMDTSSQHIITLAILLLTQRDTLQAFTLISSSSLTHGQITEAGILNATANVCKTLVEQEGGNFALLPNQLAVDSLAEACLFTDSVKTFQIAIRVISSRNAAVDLERPFSEEYHFDDESFIRGRSLITRGLATIKANIKQGNFISARLTVGEILHTLQDFYSHSNWVELGNMFAYSNLIRADLNIDNIADSSTPTCRNCVGDNCENNILENIITEKKLTSGYFNLFSSSKPDGKCSHGGAVDQTSDSDPRGGINKDAVDSEHGHLHTQAAQTAIAATTELLLDIRGAAGDADFLRLMGISRSSSSSSSALCFVVDTSASMANVLAELKKVTSSIINSISKLPSVFILISFSNTGLGPLLRTTESDIFLSQINILSASGGGNSPEPGRSLEALWMALSEAPPSSQIFVFTDAPPTDAHLESTVLALIETTQTGVNFFLTNVGRSGQRSNELYQSLTEASGGQAIVITEEQFPQAVTIITDSIRPALVTISQTVRDPGTTETFSFTVDDSVKNLTVYITGSTPSFTIISASGASQSSGTSSGSLGTIQTEGNFISVLLNSPPQKGQWRINMNSLQPYTITVTGESAIDFLYDIVEVFQSPTPGFATLESRPPASGNTSLSVTLTGGSSIKLTDVALIQVSGSDEVKGTVEKTDSGGYLVTMTRVPEGSFYVQLRGTNESSTSSDNVFQRQSSNQLKASTISIKAQENLNWKPGTNLTIPFTMTTTNSTGGNFTIQARNSRGLSSSFPSSVTLEAGGRTEGTVTLTAPLDTPSGTDVTLTIEAEAPGGSDSNYVVLRLTVIADVADITAPVCQVVSVNSNCNGNCTLQTWDFTASLNDGNGTGIERITASETLGNLTTSTQPGPEGFNVTVAFFSAPCCTEEVILVAVDAVGNVGSCTIRSGGVQLRSPPLSLWISVACLVLARTLSL